MRKFKIFISLIFISVLIFRGIKRGNAAINGNALWRSAILPGWGQFYNNEIPKGAIIFGIHQILVSGSIISFITSESKYNEYINATSSFNEKWNNYTASLMIFKIIVGTTGAFYLYNLIDAAMTKEKRYIEKMDINNNEGLSLKLSANKSGIEYKKRF